MISPVRAAIVLAAVFFLACPSCTVKKEERAPGPLTVWLMSDPQSKIERGIVASDFKNLYSVPLELSFKDPFEIVVALRDHQDDVLGKVDLIELDLFDLEEMAPLMEDLKPLLLSLEGRRYLYNPAVEAAEFDGRQCFFPVGLSWPALVKKTGIESNLENYRDLMGVGRENPGWIAFPALNDRDFFALLCSLVWAFGGDPSQPDDPGLKRAFAWLEQMSEYISLESTIIGPGDATNIPMERRPYVFFEWPQGLISLDIGGELYIDYKALPVPCGDVNKCPAFFFGRYLGVPRGAPHLRDAFRFIGHMVNPDIQRQLLFASRWLPVRGDGWGEMGARAEAYQALSIRADDIRKPPPNLKKVKEALTRAGTMVLFEKEGASEALERYAAEMQ